MLFLLSLVSFPTFSLTSKFSPKTPPHWAEDQKSLLQMLCQTVEALKVSKPIFYFFLVLFLYCYTRGKTCDNILSLGLFIYLLIIFIVFLLFIHSKGLGCAWEPYSFHSSLWYLVHLAIGHMHIFMWSVLTVKHAHLARSVTNKWEAIALLVGFYWLPPLVVSWLLIGPGQDDASLFFLWVLCTILRQGSLHWLRFPSAVFLADRSVKKKRSVGGLKANVTTVSELQAIKNAQ